MLEVSWHMIFGESAVLDPVPQCSLLYCPTSEEPATETEPASSQDQTAYEQQQAGAEQQQAAYEQQEAAAGQEQTASEQQQAASGQQQAAAEQQQTAAGQEAAWNALQQGKQHETQHQHHRQRRSLFWHMT